VARHISRVPRQARTTAAQQFAWPLKATAAAVTRVPDVVPELWMKLRVRWEYGHAAEFVLQCIGWASLLWSVLAPRSDISSGTLRADARDVERGDGRTAVIRDVGRVVLIQSRVLDVANH
jgi:hypothetical protein